MKLLSNYKGLFVLVTFIFMFILTDSVTALAATVKLPKTGQTTCYDNSGNVILCAGTGQDGDIQAGESWPSLRFTVSDWRDDFSGNCVIDKLTGLMWARIPDSILRTWQAALNYANNLNLCGYTDWRLPNINELESLVNAGQPNPAAWLNSHGFNNVDIYGIYWSSTSLAHELDNAWVIYMGQGDMLRGPKSGGYYYNVLPVRSGISEITGLAKLWKTGQTKCYDSSGIEVASCAGTGQDGDIQAGESWPSPRFTDNGNGTVTDNLTGLMWTKNANLPGSYKTWQQALDYVAGMNSGIYPNFGYNDWRLPNLKEMHSLTDFSQYTPALPSGHPFLNVDLSYYWLSTAVASDPDNAWEIYMDTGEINGGGVKSSNYSFVWPVRSGQIGGPNPDTDGDGLLDTWEEFGYDWPGNGTGTIDVDLPGMGAKKDHKDIFIEVDYMVKTTTGGGYEDGTSDPNACTDGSDNGPKYDGLIDSADPDCLPHSHQPMTTALQTVIDAFNNAPVDNPDKTTGIRIHIDAGPSSIMNPASGATWGTRSRSTPLAHSDILGKITNWDYDWADFQNLKDNNFDKARLAIFHYAIFAHDQPNPGGRGMSRNSEDFSTGAGDFITTLGFTKSGVGNSNEQAHILMHELGHNLGLRHGGGDHINGKPNYLSVMNYSFGRDLGLIKNGNPHFDYSQFTPANLYEGNLNETIGLNGGTAMDSYGTRWWCAGNPPFWKQTFAVNSPIDWNCDGDGGIDNPTSANINGDYDINTNNAIFSALISQNDWDNIIYAGGAIGDAFADFSDDPMITPTTDVEPFPAELEEDCDGIDNDGDGRIDEGFPAGNTPCGVNVQVVPNGVTTTFPSVSWSGDTTVTTSNTGPAPPSGFKLGSSATYYEITSTATFTGSVQICIGYNETQFTSERSLKLFHWEGTGWNNITTSLNTAANIICGLTTSFSPFLVAEESSTAVTLSNLSATIDGGQVVLYWTTGVEIDNEGFIILRAESATGPFVQITPSMIPAIGGLGMKAAYTYRDADVKPGKTYYYQLKDIDNRGVVTAHNVITVTLAVADGGYSGGTKAQGDEIAPGPPVTVNRPATWAPAVSEDMKKISIGGEVFTTGSGLTDQAENLSIRDLTGEDTGQQEESLRPPQESSHSGILNVDSGGEGYSEPQHTPPGTSSLFITIEDRMGNLIKIKRMEGASPADSAATAGSEPTTLKVSEESGHVVVTWQGAGSGKGFVLYRTEKGKENYKPISGTIPYFGRDGKDQYRYLFIDKGAKSVKEYEYRLEIVRADAVDKVAKQ